MKAVNKAVEDHIESHHFGIETHLAWLNRFKCLHWIAPLWNWNLNFLKAGNYCFHIESHHFGIETIKTVSPLTITSALNRTTLELKLFNRFLISLIQNSLNRTTLELKHSFSILIRLCNCWHWIAPLWNWNIWVQPIWVQPISLNRTTLELKLVYPYL